MLACSNLGVMYENAKGVNEDKKKAAKLYLKACSSEEITSCKNLGVLYYKGQGVLASNEKALDFSKIACDGGDKGACNNFSIIYKEVCANNQNKYCSKYQ